MGLCTFQNARRHYKARIPSILRYSLWFVYGLSSFNSYTNLISVEDRDNDKTEADMFRVKTMGTIRLTVCAVTSEKSVTYEVTALPMRPEMELAHKATILHGQGLTHGTT